MRWLICTASYRWFDRQFWQLSSLVDQVGSHVPEITYHVHTHRDDPHIDKFREIQAASAALPPNIRFENIEWGNSDFGIRHFVRTDDLHYIGHYDWVIWLDPDIVMHRDFCSSLAWKMKRDLADCNNVLSIGRINRNFNDACELLEERMRANVDRYSDVDKTWIRGISEMLGIDDMCSRSTLAAGYFQAVRCEALIKKNITTYGDIPNQVDRSFLPNGKGIRRLYRTYSEKYFRRMLGIRPIGRLPALWHLEHPRRGDIDWDEEACY